MKKCPVCGHIMEDEARFCSLCGEKLPQCPTTIDQVEVAEPIDEAVPLAAKEKKKVRFKPFLIISAVLLALIAVTPIFASDPEAVLKKEITEYCAKQFPELKIEDIEIGEIEIKKGSYTSWRNAEVTLTIDGALTTSEYDHLYSGLSEKIFSSDTFARPLKIIEDSGKDFESGYQVRMKTNATPSPAPSSISNPGYGFTTEDAKWAVYKMAKEQIPDYLNCPSTMKICAYDDATIRDAGYNIWKGEGYFDAENLYGATVRGKWNITCKIENGVCHLAKLKIDDIVVYNDGTQ